MIDVNVIDVNNVGWQLRRKYLKKTLVVIRNRSGLKVLYNIDSCKNSSVLLYLVS